MTARGAPIVPSTVRSSQVGHAPPVKHMHDVPSIGVHERSVSRHQHLVVIYSIAAEGAYPLIQLLLFCVISCSMQSRNVRWVWAFKHHVYFRQLPEICDLLVDPLTCRLHSVETLWSMILNPSDLWSGCLLRSPEHVQVNCVRSVADWRECILNRLGLRVKCA